MPSSDEPSIPSEHLEAQPLHVIDPKTGREIRVADMRAEFERLSRQQPRNPEAERAFIEGKIEMIRADPQLSEAAKERAITQLRSGL